MAQALTLEEKIKRANIRLLMTNPFFGTLLLRMKVKEVQKGEMRCDTMATDGRNIFFVAEYVENLPDLKLQGLMAHETMHVALGHQLRRGDRDPERWNIACDAAIDWLLKDAGLDVPDSFADQPMWAWAKGMAAEEVYHKLPFPQEGGFPGMGPAGGGKPPPGANRPGGVLDSPGKGNAAAEAEEEAENHIAVKQAGMAEKSKRGSVPAWMKGLIDEVCEPKIKWEDHLRVFIGGHTPSGQTWSRPNRRFAYQNLFLPGVLMAGIGEGVIFVDTSGSTHSFWAQFFGECKSILEDHAPDRIHMIQCDAAVGDIRTYENGEELSMEIFGGGGSDFRPAFRAVEEANIKPQWAVVLSDMDIAFPPNAPEYPVLMVSTNKQKGPDWADTVHMF